MAWLDNQWMANYADTAPINVKIVNEEQKTKETFLSKKYSSKEEAVKVMNAENSNPEKNKKVTYYVYGPIKDYYTGSDIWMIWQSFNVEEPMWVYEKNKSPEIKSVIQQIKDSYNELFNYWK